MNDVSTKTAATAEPMRATFDAQRSAFARQSPPYLQQRRSDLTKLKDAVEKNADRLAQAISADFGNRSRHETEIGEVLPVLAAIRHARRHLRDWMRPKSVPVPAELLPARARILYQPVGVVGIISPWNYPFQLAVAPLVAALSAGNRVMLKPSELTTRTADFLSELLAAIFPADQVATVTGGPDTGRAFAGLPFDHLFYTGSTAVGRMVMKAAAENLTPVTLELGGKSPCILAEDAALPGAVDSIVYGKLLNSGQTCIAPDYVLVPERKLDEFVKLASGTIAKFYPALAVNPDYTSIIDARHYQRLTQYIAAAKASGARVIEINPAHEPLPAETRKLAPTLVIDPQDDLAIMREEIFGPLLPVKTYRRIDDAIDYVNSRPRPLALYYFGASRDQRNEVLRRTLSGGASINTTLFHFAVEDLPFGGIGASGIGTYHGEFGFQTFSHRKAVFLQSRINGARLLYPPFGRLTDVVLRLVGRR